ncbi:MAG: hypothetical protein RI988_3454 [Pseudomonadota bacterium]|jgi:hypothetical protein
MTPEMIVRMIEMEQARVANTLLSTPAGRDAFEYGRAVGLHEGYQRVRDLLLNAFQEQERKSYNA